ncbi:cuticle protein 10.6 isoform X1 [Folsomia candida]|uniref:cuticle protein 10.6 isoform X1 n=1 Tax=Folsomia candida TaxID=158441 RepID=UPI000B9012C9|nr:cuticle protein 10.6 isoform X1 [Folsomia candida]
MNSVAVIILAVASAVSAGVIAPAFAPAPLGYTHGFAAPAVYPGYGLQVAHAPVLHAPVVTKVAAPIAYAAHPVAYPYAHAPIVKTAAVAYTAPLLAKAAVPAFAPAYGAYAAPAGLHYL